MGSLLFVSILLIIVIILLLVIIFLNLKEDPSKSSNEESIKEIDKAMERQEISISDLTRGIQSFQDPLDKLKRYLSGGTLAGKFGEWSLEAIIKDIFNSKHYESNYEVIPGSGKRVEFVIRLPEDLLLPIDAKFPSALFDNYLKATESGDEKLEKKIFFLYFSCWCWI